MNQLNNNVYITKKEDMNKERIKELHFMLRTGAPIPLTDSRAAERYQTIFYDDYFTISELVEQKQIEYVGHRKEYICLRPYANFSVFVSGDVRDLKSGEIVTMSLTDNGRAEFNTWLAAQ